MNIRSLIGLHLLILVILLAYACNEPSKNVPPRSAEPENSTPVKATYKSPKLSDEFKDYWYAGEAEITSYELKQARYGEIREGNSTLIFVTEPFLKFKQVKADGKKKSNVPVLKLNSTKNYLTGIYPYSIMSSSFYPLRDLKHAIKLSTSVQEWCGHVYVQLNNRENFDIKSHSYFENEADQEIKLDKNYLENELWNMIRVWPEELPLGEIKLIPSLEHLRMAHKEIKAYSATTSLVEKGNLSIYKIEYPDLERTLSIHFSSAFPYSIEGWEEETVGGYGENKKKLISSAKKIKRIKSPYWRQNSNADIIWRDSLGL